jgi:hypothetical protein
MFHHRFHSHHRVCFTLHTGIHTNRIGSYHTFVFIPKQYVMYYRKSFTSDCLIHKSYLIHTMWVDVLTQVVRVHTRNKFIHTEIEQFILYGNHITLIQVSSHSKLAT